MKLIMIWNDMLQRVYFDNVGCQTELLQIRIVLCCVVNGTGHFVIESLVMNREQDASALPPS